MKIIQFVKPYKIYSASDVAGFDDAVADAIVDAGFAKNYVDESDADTASGAKNSKSKE